MTGCSAISASTTAASSTWRGSVGLIPTALIGDRFRPLAAGDRGEAVGRRHEPVPRLAAGRDDGVVVRPDPQAELVLAQVLPDVLDRVQLCALRRCTGSVGASPTRQLSLQPEAPGADQEVTNGLKHLGKRPLSGASGPCGPQRERTPSRPRKCPMWEPTRQLNGEGRRRRASERDTPPPIPPG